MERIKAHGLHVAIVIDTDNTILSGNQRKVALTKLGIKDVNVLVPNRKLSDDQRRKIGLESNLNDGEWDFERLKTFESDFLSDIGFDEVDLSKIWPDELESKNDEFDEVKELSKIKVPKTKAGDLMILGT